MANTRRSARLSRTVADRSSTRKTPVSNARLDSLVERDETPEVSQPSIDGVLATPTTVRSVKDTATYASSLRTPKTEPRPERGDMHPKTVHQTTSKAPDSGLKLGFADISTATDFTNTPSKSASKPKPALRQSMSSTMPTQFEFKFSSDATLSTEAQRLMESVRADAARIKEQMAAEKAAQDEKDAKADGMRGTARKIAVAKGKAGRFSDVHMAQFKKMDSIANHPSAFRARPGFIASTAQSLKRSPSKAGFDDLERPRTAGKMTPKRITPPILGRATSTSPFKSIPTASDRLENTAPPKRARRSEFDDVSTGRTSNTPKAVFSRLISPTKSSLARTSTTSISKSPDKSSMLPRSNSVRTIKTTSPERLVTTAPRPAQFPVSPSKQSQPIVMNFKPLPPLPLEHKKVLQQSQSLKNLNTPPVDNQQSSPSRLPTFSGLKSILRSPRKGNKPIYRPDTPKRPNTANPTVDSAKKVDFTPSVKSRYAVKLAAGSPSPAKQRIDTPRPVTGPLGVPYDASVYMVPDFGSIEMEADLEVTYPTLPDVPPSPGPVVHTFTAKAKQHNRRESKEFKSIFTNLHPERSGPPATLTSVNTTINRTDPLTHANQILRSPSNPSLEPSPSTIRRVRGSGISSLVQPFEDRGKTVPHELPGKKRRRESTDESDKTGSGAEARGNRRGSEVPVIPGAWDDTISEDENMDPVDDEGSKRGGKRARTVSASVESEKSPVKKPNAAREAAAKNAKDRKKRGILSLSRLNMLSRPKQRT